MKNIIRIIQIIVLIFIIFLISNYIFPIKYNNSCLDNNIYRQKLSIYKIDTIFNKVRYKKIGGILEYFGVRKTKCLKEIKLEYLLSIKRKMDSTNIELQWKKLDCGLWVNKNKELGYKSSRVIGMEGMVSGDYYVTKFGWNEGEHLNTVIDTTTFKQIGNTFFKDKNNIYHTYAMICGESFYIYDIADYKTFEIIGDCYAKDKNHIYIERKGNVDIDTIVDFKTFTSIKGIGCFAKDKNNYYHWDYIIPEKEMNREYIKEVLNKLNKASR